MRKLYTLCLLSVYIFSLSCSKRNDSASSKPDILTYRIEGQKTEVHIAPNSINIIFPDSIMNANNLVADFTLSPGCHASVNGVEQVSGVSKNNYSSFFKYTITNASNSTLDWKVSSTNSSWSQPWGLGNFITLKESNDKTYTWYLDQMNTGLYASDNCGPTSVTMVCKWADSTFTGTPEDARMAYRNSGGWWFTDDIDHYLSDNGVTHTIINLGQTADGTQQILKHEIDLHQLLILCIDMNYIRLTSNENYHIDKFYNTTPNFGHFFIIKGYIKVDNEVYFQVYDPNSWGRENSDGSLKGKDRFYRYEDVFAASNIWWQYAFVIAKKGSPLKETSLLPNRPIPVQYGR